MSLSLGCRLGVLVLMLLASWPASPAVGAERPATAVPTPEPRQAVTEVFASQRYQFCHRPDYPLTPVEKRWCALGAGANPACPTLAEACTREAAAKHLDLDEPFTLHLPDLGLPARLLLWALLAVALTLLILALVRHFLDRKAKEVVATAAPSATEDDQASALARQVETDVQRLLERARQEAAAGDFRAAIGSVYAALLRRLEGVGVVRVEPDQTNGDYLRQVKREHPAFASRMGEVVDGVERAQFGKTAVNRDNFDRVWGRVTSLLTERIGVVLIMCGMLVATSCRHPRGDWEHSPSGRAGIIAFLGKRGFTVRERLLAVAKLGQDTAGTGQPRAMRTDDSTPEADPPGDKPSVDTKPTTGPATQLVLLPGAQMRDEDWQAVKTWLDRGGRTLVVAGGTWQLPGWVGARIIDGKTESEAITPADREDKRWGGLNARIPGTHRVEAAGAHPLLARKPSVYAIERWLESYEVGPREEENQEGAVHEVAAGDEVDKIDGTGEVDDAEVTDEADEVVSSNLSRVVVLADDSLWRNASLLVADNAALLEALLRDGGTSVELAGDLTGLVATNPVQSVERGRLGPALLQLAAFLLLFFVCKGTRFGRPVPEPQSERRAFVEHVRALGMHYARARAERVALAALGAYVIDRLREHFGLHVDRSLSGLAEAVAARTGRPVGEVMRMFLEARDAGKAVPADNEARDLETAGQLCRLLEETGGIGGHKRIQSHV